MDKFSELKAAAMAATPQKIDGAQEKTEDGCMECPCCSGDGQVDVGADYCNYDNTAIGVIFYGIGDAHVAAERYFRAANPATVLSLLAELEAKDDALRAIAFHVSAGGYNADSVDAEVFKQKIIDGINGISDVLVKRLAELSRLLEHNIERAESAEAKLATPVRLPNKNDDEFWFDGVFQVAKFDRAVERAISAAGFKFVGDE